MAKRLKKLRIDEVSAVTAAANPYATVKIMKRVTGFDDTGELLINGVPRWRLKLRKTGDVTKVGTGTSVERALAEVEEHKQFKKAHAATSTKDEHPMETEVMKVAIAKVVSRIDAIIAKSDKPISRVVAIGRMAS